jgi:hypothetical protein
LGKIYLAGTTFGNQKDIPVAYDTMPVKAKILTNSSLDSVSLRSLSDFPGDRDPKATVREFVWPYGGKKIGAVDLFAAAAKSDKLGSL